jgi:hypothetical protein
MTVQIDLSEFMKSSKGPCKIGRLAGNLNEEDLAKFNAALAERIISVEAICKWLTAKTGEQAKNPTLRNHRIGACSCD